MRKSYLSGSVFLASLLLSVTALHAADNVTISTSASQNIAFADGVFTPTGDDAVLNVSDLENALASGAATINSGTTGSQAGDITVAAPFSWTSSNGLTLDAFHSIRVNKPISDAGPGALTLTTNDGGSGGNLFFFGKGKVSFLSTANALTINGKNYTLVNSVSTLATAIAKNPSGFYALSNDYNAKKDGTYSTAPIATTFSGNFNGLGNAISNLTISFTGRLPRLGLFYAIDTDGAVNSANLTKVKISGGSGTEAGALAVLNKGVVFNSRADGLIATKGGGREGPAVGGLVVSNIGVIRFSSAGIDVSVKEKGTGVAVVGGLVAGSSVGSRIDGSFATGMVTARGSHVELGGIVGDSPGQITNCYARGDVVGSYQVYIGGFAGAVDTGSVTSAYSTGRVRGGGVVGGFAGDSTHSTIATSYWDTLTSGQDEGTGDGNVPGLTGLKTKQFKSGLPAGFDPAVWAQDKKINNGYPYLIDNPPPK